MQVVIDSIVNVILGVFSLTEADWAALQAKLAPFDNCVFLNTAHRVCETIIHAASEKAEVRLYNTIFMNCLIPIKLDSARVGLRRAGGAAIGQYLAAAAASGNPYQAADNYLAVDDLQKRALTVGIFLPGPNGYDESKRAAFDKGIATAITDARLLTNTRASAIAPKRAQSWR